MVMGVPCLKFYLLSLGRLTEDQTPPRRQLREQIPAVAYLMLDASGLGYGSVLWVQGKLVSELGGFNPLYQGRSSNFREGDNLTTCIKESVASGELKGVEFFVLTDNLVFESLFCKETSKSPLLFELVLGLHQVHIRGELALHVIQIAGT